MPPEAALQAPPSRPAALPVLAPPLLQWQRSQGRRGLPWMGSRDPYRVWLSEVMLQQTQVATVRAYYARFVERFPDVATLAAAPLDEVLALWSGLGYYSRARHLHRCAQVVCAEHGGAFPRSAAALQALPGIGRSTAAAIAAFCFGERAAILDGNVKRVLARVLAFDEDLACSAAQRALWAQAEALLPPAADMPDYTQGLMDLGATLCSVRRPQCGACPLRALCAAAGAGVPERYPVKSRRLRRSRRCNALLWLRHRGRQWLVQRPAPGVWGGLWSLPEHGTPDALQAHVAQWPGSGEWLPPIRHALTHFDWTLEVLAWDWPARAAAPRGLPAPGRWADDAEALSLGLPAPLRKLLQQRG